MLLQYDVEKRGEEPMWGKGHRPRQRCGPAL